MQNDGSFAKGSSSGGGMQPTKLPMQRCFATKISACNSNAGANTNLEANYSCSVNVEKLFVKLKRSFSMPAADTSVILNFR